MVERGNGPAQKTVNGKEYYWCPKHNCWVRHKPEDCELDQEGARQRQAGAEPTESPQMRLQTALHTIITE